MARFIVFRGGATVNEALVLVLESEGVGGGGVVGCRQALSADRRSALPSDRFRYGARIASVSTTRVGGLSFDVEDGLSTLQQMAPTGISP